MRLPFGSSYGNNRKRYRYLKDCHSQVLQQKLKDLDRAFRDCFDKNQPLKRLPTWRKQMVHDSFRFPQGFKLANRRIYLPKIGWVGFFKSTQIQGVPKNVTVSRNGKYWYCSIQVEMELPEVSHPSKSAIGVDLGIAKFAALSDGTHIEPTHPFRTLENKLSRSQRCLSRKKKFSSNWKKQKKKIQDIHRKIANVRRDFLHKASTYLSNNHALIVVEDLKITNMSKSAKGSLESPGTCVKAKSGLNKSILDQGWGEFRRQLAYKLEWLGGSFLKINPRYTSQCCNKCGYTAKENRPTQAIFQCHQCHHEENADTNAARNILAAGHAVLACGEIGLPNSMKQEPLGIGHLVPA